MTYNQYNQQRYARERDMDEFRDVGQWRRPPQPGPPEWKPEVKYGSYMFIRVDVDYAEVSAQTVVLSKRSVQCYKGAFIGIARKIYDLSSYGRKHPESMIIYWFASDFGAERFFVSDNRFKQHDFPSPSGHCEAWTMVKYREADDRFFRTYMLCYTTLKNPAMFREYRDRVNDRLGRLIESYGGVPFVVQNVGVHSLRRHLVDENTMVTVHLFKDQEDVKALMRSDEYGAIKKEQLDMAMDTTSVFTIDPQACP